MLYTLMLNEDELHMVTRALSEYEFSVSNPDRPFSLDPAAARAAHDVSDYVASEYHTQRMKLGRVREK